MKGPITPLEFAKAHDLGMTRTNRFIEQGELDAVIHPEAEELFWRSKQVGSPYIGSTAAAIRAELDRCDVILLAQYMDGEGGAGSFFSAISRALMLADPGNRRSLYAAFPYTMHGYLLRQRAWAERNDMGRA